jgi:uncharacterized membrane protein
MSSKTNSTPTSSLGTISLNAFIAGVIAAMINVIIFFIGRAVVGGIDVDMNGAGTFAPMPFFLPVVASLLLTLVAGLGLWIARRFIPKGNQVFVIGTAILVLLSLAAPFNGQIATTSAAIVLAVMHLVVGALMIGYLAQR